jgi:GAF domain-containing protein
MSLQPIKNTTAHRLALLAKYNILDTPPEADFDDLTHLAATLCGTPIALISLLDADRQWFKSRCGLEATETPIEQAICAHAVAQSDLGNTFIVADAAQDARFAENPLVTGDIGLRFYAGQSLIARDGTPVGTICVVDRVARPDGLNATQQQALRVLARQVVAQMELRQTVQHLARVLTEKAAMQAEVKELRALLPICSYCKDVRNDQDYWQSVEEYLASQGDVLCSHGVCPNCFDRALGDMGLPSQPYPVELGARATQPAA